MADENLPMLKSALVTPADASALHYKVVDFIQEIDPFGDRFSAHELSIIGEAFADYGVQLVSRHLAEGETRASTPFTRQFKKDCEELHRRLEA